MESQVGLQYGGANTAIHEHWEATASLPLPSSTSGGAVYLSLVWLSDLGRPSNLERQSNEVAVFWGGAVLPSRISCY